LTTFVEEFYDDDDDDDDGAKAWTALAKTTWTSGVLRYCIAYVDSTVTEIRKISS